MNYLSAGMVNMPVSLCLRNIDATSSLCSQDRFEVAAGREGARASQSPPSMAPPSSLCTEKRLYLPS